MSVLDDDKDDEDDDEEEVKLKYIFGFVVAGEYLECPPKRCFCKAVRITQNFRYNKYTTTIFVSFQKN